MESREEGSERKVDMDYYEMDGHSCLEAIAIATEGLEGIDAFIVGNMVKYSRRAGRKPGEPFEADMEKCGHYARILCERRDV